MLRFVPRKTIEPAFECPEGMNRLIYRLLAARGVSTAEEARAFLNPTADDLRDPLLLNDMAAVVDLLNEARAQSLRVCVYGDYDVDGVCASAILTLYLRSAGWDAGVYIPSRHEEGYGLNDAAVRAIAEEYDVLVTVDNGIAASELIALAQSLGLRCAVTDHHRIEGALPPCPTVDPLLADYPFGYICGAGVAFKLVWALGGRESALKYVDLAALATVADVVPLRDENRVIVRLGLDAMNRAPRTGIAQLMQVSGIAPGALNAQGIAFRLAPRLNASGRVGSAMRAYTLLTTQDEFEAVALADELERENRARQEMEDAMRREALTQIAGMDLSSHGILLVRGTDWNKGVIGLLAGRLREKYYYPVIALSEQDGELTGSCRSIDGADIFAALTSVADRLDRYGGHAQAAGLSFPAKRFNEVWRGLDAYFRENVPPAAYTPTVEYDMELPIGEIGEAEVKALAALEPTGAGNPAPLFFARVNIDEARAVGRDGAHLQLKLAQGDAQRKAICFGAGDRAEQLGAAAEVVYVPELNEWRGTVSVQLQVPALREADPAERLEALKASGGDGALFRGFLTEAFYAQRAEPSRAVGRMTRAALNAALERAPFGTWILCGDADSAAEILRSAPAQSLDLFVGNMPDDPRCFNALILSPGKIAAAPKGVRRLVVCGMPALKEVFGAAPLYELDDSPAPDTQPPDLDALRRIYVAGRQLMRQGGRIRDIEALAAALAAASGEDATVCLKGALILADAGLFTLTLQPFGFGVVTGVKASPTASAVHRALEAGAQHAYQGVGKV